MNSNREGIKIEQLINVAIICDVQDNTPVGVICSNSSNGDIAYSTDNYMLTNSLEIILDDKLYLPIDENLNDNRIIREENILPNDNYYLIALNYSLPFPWRILGVTKTEGDVEEVSNSVFLELKNKEAIPHEK